MTAAEKLRALHMSGDLMDLEALYKLLPALADVVEAAENFTTYGNPQRRVNLLGALSALNEALK